MSVVALTILLCTSWVFANIWLVPRLRRRWHKGDLARKVLHAGTLAVVEKLRDASGAGALTLMLVLLGVWGSAMAGSGAHVISKSLIDSLSTAYSVVQAVASSYAMFLAWFGGIALAAGLFLVWREARNAVTGTVAKRAETVLRRLQRNPSVVDQWQVDDPKMVAPVGMLNELQRRRESDEDSAELDVASGQHQSLIESLQQSVAVRRSVYELETEGAFRPPAKTGVRAGGSRWRKLARLIISPRLSRDLGLVSRWLWWSVTGLLVVSLIGWSSPMLADSLRIAVNNLRMHAAHVSAERAMSDSLDRGEVDPKPITDAELNHLVRMLAKATVDGMTRSGVLARSVSIAWPKTAASEVVRAEILGRTWRGETGNAVGPAANQIRSIVAQRGARSSLLGGRDAFQGVESAVRPLVEELRKTKTGVLRRLMDALATRYSDAVVSRDVQSSLLSRMVSTSVGIVDPGGSNELDKLVSCAINRLK